MGYPKDLLCDPSIIAEWRQGRRAALVGYVSSFRILLRKSNRCSVRRYPVKQRTVRDQHVEVAVERTGGADDPPVQPARQGTQLLRALMSPPAPGPQSTADFPVIGDSCGSCGCRRTLDLQHGGVPSKRIRGSRHGARHYRVEPG
jgi:hypothetical protein